MKLCKHVLIVECKFLLANITFTVQCKKKKPQKNKTYSLRILKKGIGKAKVEIYQTMHRY